MLCSNFFVNKFPCASARLSARLLYIIPSLTTYIRILYLVCMMLHRGIREMQKKENTHH